MKALLLNPNCEYSEGYEEKRENYIEVKLLAYDRDKYVFLKLPDGTCEEFKSGYIRRTDNFGYLTKRQLFSLPVLTWGEDKKYGAKPSKRKVQSELRKEYKKSTTFMLYVSNCMKGLDRNTITVKTRTLKKATSVFRKYKYSELFFKRGDWNYTGIAERDHLINNGALFYTQDYKSGRPTYSAKVLRNLE